MGDKSYNRTKNDDFLKCALRNARLRLERQKKKTHIHNLPNSLDEDFEMAL